MNKSNTPPFYVGEEVEYITGKSMPKGTKVIVLDVFKSPCGCWAIVHNKPIKNEIVRPEHFWSECTECGNVYLINKMVGKSIGWVASSFRRIQHPKPMTFVKLAEIIETEKEEVLTLN